MRKLYVVAALLALVGLADALYLTIEHVTGQSVRCTIISGCSEVLSSPYAVVAGIPLAMIGAAAYFTVFSLAILAAFGYGIAGKLLLPLGGGMFLAGLAGGIAAVADWGSRGFGDLEASRALRLVIPSVTLMILGAQGVMSSFFLSVLGLRRR